MKNEVYKKQMKKIRPSDELIEKTIANIKKVNNENNPNKLKNADKLRRLVAGTAAALTLSVGSVGAYIAVTGNTQILEKIGIKLSQNYEQNQQVITEQNSAISKFSSEGIEATLRSAAVDNASLVMEIDLKLDEQFEGQEFNLKTGNISIYLPSRGISWGESFEITEKDSIQKMEDGTYKMFKYLAIKDPNIAANSIWLDVFYLDEKVNCTIEFQNLSDNSGNEIIVNEEDNWKFEFELTKPEKLNDDVQIPTEVIQTLNYNNVEITVDAINYSDFGNIITINANEKNINLNKINDIQKIDFIVKDSNGNSMNIVSRTQNITVGDYKDGNMTSICLEGIQLIVDDITQNPTYKVEVFGSEKLLVTMEEIQKANKTVLDTLKNGDTVLTASGSSYPSEILDANGIEYYIDKYGVYRIDKTYEEINAEVEKNKNAIIDRTLTNDELKEIEEFLNQTENNGFVTQNNIYQSAEEINLNEVFYNCGGDTKISNEEMSSYKKATGIKEKYATLSKITTAYAQKLYEEKTGNTITKQELINRLTGWTYLEQYDAFYSTISDSNFDLIESVAGYKAVANDANIDYMIAIRHSDSDAPYSTIVLLGENENGYIFIANVELSK